MSEETEDKADLILYSADDGAVSIQLRVGDGRVWLSQVEIAELFQTTPQNVNQHIAAIFREGELVEEATSKDYLLVRLEGGREVRRAIRHFSLEMILAIGYRVELRAKSRKAMTMADWEAEIDRLLAFTEKPLLRNAGSVSHARMEAIAHQRFETFDAARRAAELEKSEAEHEAESEKIIEEAAKAKSGNKGKKE